jgi:hypothetical protein
MFGVLSKLLKLRFDRYLYHNFKPTQKHFFDLKGIFVQCGHEPRRNLRHARSQTPLFSDIYAASVTLAGRPDFTAIISGIARAGRSRVPGGLRYGSILPTGAFSGLIGEFSNVILKEKSN